MAKQSETVLRIEGAIAKQLATALKKSKPVAAILALLDKGKHVDVAHPPQWLAFNDGGFLDTVVHLHPPAFYATGADEDEFWSEPPRPQIVFDAKGACQRVSRAGETTDVKVAAKNLGTITAFDLGGFLLQDITWLGKVPATFAAAKLLFETAGDAYTGDLAPYDVRTDDAPVAPVTGSSDVRGDAFLGSASRAGAYAARPSRKKPKLVWQAAQDSESSGSEHGCDPVVAGDLILAGGDGYNAKCSATKLTGKAAWKTTLTKNQSWPIGSAHHADGVVYQGTNQGLFALDAKTSKQKWLSRQSALDGTPLVIGDQVFVGTGEGVVGLALATGRKQWKFAVKRNEYKQGVTGGLAYADGTLYFVAENKLFAVDLATAKKRWTTPAHGRCTPSVDATSVFTWSPKGLTAVDRATGKVRWTAKQNNLDWDKTIAVGDDRVLARFDGKLTAFAKQTGKRLWSIGPKQPYNIGCASPVIAGDVALCVLVNETPDETVLYAADLKTGKLLWTQGAFRSGKNESPISWYCTPTVLADGTVIVQAYGLCALR